MTSPRYSIVIPAYRRPDLLAKVLASVCALDYPLDTIEVIVIDDNGEDLHSRDVAAPFIGRVPIRYLLNARNRGHGFSVNRGIIESAGDRIMLLNDDALLQPDILKECDRLLAADPKIGCIGCRAIERGYYHAGEGIGRMLETGEVIGNFDVDCGSPIEVEHVYGFCYVFTREALRRAGVCDRTLLAQRYSTGGRIDTDHSLCIRRTGLKVVYNPRMAAVHLALPREDMSEVSLRWHLNHIRNTIYLYLKHYGPFGKGAAALKLTFLVDVGLLSTLRRPTYSNIAYFLNGLRGRASAYGHYIKYLCNSRIDSPDAFRRQLDAETMGAGTV
jgi:GT2 family glycosyltransferase